MLVQPFETFEHLLLLSDDLALDLGGGCARPVSLDVEDRLADIGRELDRDRLQRDEAEHDHHQNRRDDRDRTVDGQPDQVHRSGTALARSSQQCRGLRGALRPTGQERRAARRAFHARGSARCGDIGQASRRTLSAGERRPSGRAQASARGVAGLNRMTLIRFSAHSWRIERLGATQAVTLLRTPG